MGDSMQNNGYQLFVEWLAIGLQENASDLHLKVGYKPYIRVSGFYAKLAINMSSVMI